jgi:hypothetical protein
MAFSADGSVLFVGDGTGIGGHGFSWSAALTLDWLTKPDSTP